MVVPMLAPMMIPIDWVNDIKPAEMNPTTNTVVTDDDCTIEVTKAPAIAPVNRFVVSLERTFLSPSPAINLRASDIWSKPNRNSAKPPTRPMTMEPTCSDSVVTSASKGKKVCERAGVVVEFLPHLNEFLKFS